MNSDPAGRPAHPALQKFLARLLRRSTLDAEEQQALLQLPCRVVQVQPRMDIVSPGETVNHACLVSKGLVARFDQMRDGRRQIAAFHIPGDMCDLHSVVAPTAAWGMAALGASTILHIPHVELRRLAHTYPRIAMAFWRDGTADASILAKWVGNLGRQAAQPRLAHLLCELGTRMEVAGLGSRTCFQLDVTQEQLADALGLTAVHVNRMMQALRAEGLVATRNHVVEIENWNALATTAEFDPAYLLLNEPSRSTPRHDLGSDRVEVTWSG
jgi:CRP-like cAMP-binding protein